MSSRKSKLLPIGIITVVLIAIAIYFKFNRTEPDKTEGIILSKKSPPVLGLLPEFELTDQAVETFGSRQLRGKAWIANFIFTRCTATCPAQTTKMGEFQEQVRDSPLWEDIRFISFIIKCMLFISVINKNTTFISYVLKSFLTFQNNF